MTLEDIEHVIGMVFPDVRLKTQLEIRVADSMPIASALAYSALLIGIFYDSFNLDKLYRMTLEIRNKDVAAAKAELMKKGKNAEVYGRPAADWVAEIFQIAEKALVAEELEFFKGGWDYERIEPALC